MPVDSVKILIILALTVFAANASSAKDILENIYKAEYKEAFDKISSQNDSIGCVLEGIAFVSRFDDLGDTLDLDSALLVLKNCKTGDFWEPLRRYEISLINSILGNTFKSILEARSAALIFEKLGDLDSKAFYAIYAYYNPFASYNLEDLKNGFENSRLFSPVFGNTLIWILYDKKKYAEALDITNILLERYPKHPVILQTKADMLFKLGMVQEAAYIYKDSEALYAKRAPGSIRYWCAVANLAKITGDNFWKEKLKSTEYKRIKHWMPDGI
jgi:tetratricopeptide (TPR) repeat protein